MVATAPARTEVAAPRADLGMLDQAASRTPGGVLRRAAGLAALLRGGFGAAAFLGAAAFFGAAFLSVAAFFGAAFLGWAALRGVAPFAT